MTVVRVKNFKIFADRHGKKRCYHRPTGTAIDLIRYPLGSAEFFAECARLVELNKALSPRPGTLGKLVKEYRASHDFTRLADTTRGDYERVFNFLTPIYDTPLAKFDRALVVRIRDRALEKHKYRFANYVRAVLSLVFNWGFERGYMESNPAEKIKNIPRPKDRARANRPWEDTERFEVLAAAPPHMKVPIALCMFTALREGDALSLPKSACDGKMIERYTQKTGQRVAWPVPAPLKKILAGAPKHNAATLAANSYGNPWTVSGFRASWRKLRVKLEEGGKIKKGLTIHGLRHSMATRLREEGFDPTTIADALGQKTEGMARHYSRDADLVKKMGGVVKKINRSEAQKRSKIVKPKIKAVKLKGKKK